MDLRARLIGHDAALPADPPSPPGQRPRADPLPLRERGDRLVLEVPSPRAHRPGPTSRRSACSSSSTSRTPSHSAQVTVLHAATEWMHMVPPPTGITGGGPSRLRPSLMGHGTVRVEPGKQVEVVEAEEDDLIEPSRGGVVKTRTRADAAGAAGGRSGSSRKGHRRGRPTRVTPPTPPPTPRSRSASRTRGRADCTRAGASRLILGSPVTLDAAPDTNRPSPA